MPLTMFRSEASRTFAAPPNLIYEILTDYDTYAEWMPHVSKSKLLAKETDLAIAELELSAPHEETVAVECIHNKNKKVLSRVIRGHFSLSQLEWTLAPTEENGCRVTLAIEGKRNWGWLTGVHRPMLRAGNCLSHLASQVSAFQPAVESGGELILDISETAEGLVCSLMGKRYILTPAKQESHG